MILCQTSTNAARSAFLQWQCDGKQRQGLFHVLMNRTRAQFKLALRYCKDHEEALRSDALANSLSEKDYSKFWDVVRKTNNSKAANYAHTVDGCSGATAIAERWRSHFEHLYNSVIDQKSEMSFHQRISCDTVRESQIKDAMSQGKISLPLVTDKSVAKTLGLIISLWRHLSIAPTIYMCICQFYST